MQNSTLTISAWNLISSCLYIVFVINTFKNLQCITTFHILFVCKDNFRLFDTAICRHCLIVSFGSNFEERNFISYNIPHALCVRHFHVDFYWNTFTPLSLLYLHFLTICFSIFYYILNFLLRILHIYIYFLCHMIKENVLILRCKIFSINSSYLLNTNCILQILSTWQVYTGICCR